MKKQYQAAAVILVVLASIHALQFDPTALDLSAACIFAALAAVAAVHGRKAGKVKE